jgi:hypothetical protein
MTNGQRLVEQVADVEDEPEWAREALDAASRR